MNKPHHTPHAWFYPSSPITGPLNFRTAEWIDAYVSAIPNRKGKAA